MTTRTRLLDIVVPVLVLGATFAAPPPASAAGDSRLRVEVLVDGRALPEHAARGTTYVEATRGREYSVRVTNLEPVRVAVAVAVDGRNVIDAKRTSAQDGRKWILEPWQSIVLDGWQVDGSRARRFFFTTEERSYAAWLGDASNAGVIEAVAFREREPGWWNPIGAWRGREDRAPADGRAGGAGGSRSGDRDGMLRGERGEEIGAQAPSAGSSGADRAQSKAEGNAQARRVPPGHDASDEAAATGIGRHVDNEITTVRFEHERSPSASARVRYGFREELVQLGVLPQPRRPDPWRREHASGFSGGYCPSP